MRRRLIGRLAGLLQATQRPHPVVRRATLASGTPIADLRIAVFDCETTGLNVAHDRIVSVGGLTLQGTRPESAPPLDFLVHPGRRIPKTSTAIHGIDDATVATAPPLALLWSAIQSLWQQRVLLGHNIAFDIAVLQHEAERHRLPFHPPDAALDIGLLFAGVRPRQPHITLERVAAEFGVAPIRRHSALGDAETCAAIWTHLLQALHAHGIATLGDAQDLMKRQRDLLHGQTRAGWAVDWLGAS